MAEADSSSKTTQMKPVMRPLEHSCLYAIISQKVSRFRTLFQLPVVLNAPDPRASSSSSSRKRDLGSSGKRGMRHRGGTQSNSLA